MVLQGDLKIIYNGRKTSAEQAVATIKPGKTIFIGTACAEPPALVRALLQCSGTAYDQEVIQTLSLGLSPDGYGKMCENIRMNALFIGPHVRASVNAGQADYTPVNLSEIGRLFEERVIPIDYAFIQVSPPDDNGDCTFGISVDITKPGAEAAGVVIAQVNKNMPRTRGDTIINIRDIDVIVESDEPLQEWKNISDMASESIMKTIGMNVASLVQDGATIQVGYGSVPDAVLKELVHKNDLGIHTEMFSNGLIDLVRSGAVTGMKKVVHRGIMTASFCIGNKALFDFVKDREDIEFYPSSYINDASLIAKHDDMVAINSALEVDITGQVCADQLGHFFYSGIGGQADFMRGAGRAHGGKPIIALPSTAQGGRVSRIVPHLSEGSSVTAPRGDVHYVVTEFGVAELRGKTIQQRVLELIQIAHPDFREALLEYARSYGYVLSDQPSISFRGTYPGQYERTVFIANHEVTFRPVRASDEDGLKELYYSFSESTVYYRFMGPRKRFSHEEVQRDANIDYDTRMVLVAIAKEEHFEKAVAVASYDLDKKTGTAEISFAVLDEWQGKGIGTFMMELLIAIGRDRGIKAFTAEIMSSNPKMLDIFYRTGLEVKTILVEDTHMVRLDLYQPGRIKLK